MHDDAGNIQRSIHRSRCADEATGLDAITLLYTQMLADVDAELAAGDEQRASVDARVVREIESGPDGTQYELDLEHRLPQLDDGDRVKLLFGQVDEMKGEVESVKGTSIVVRLRQPLPKLARHAVRVSPDDRWLVERLRTTLIHRRAAQVDGPAEDGFNDELARLAIGRGDYDDNRVPFPPLPEPDHNRILDRLNEEQRDAVERALSSRVFYLSGPAGTGKTTTITAYVEAQVQAGRRVLVTAPSNAAADVLTLALADRLQAADGFDEGQMLLRVGRHPVEAVQRLWGDRVLPDPVAQRLVADRYAVPTAYVESALQAAERALRSAREESAAWQRAARRRARFTSEAADLHRMRLALAGAECAALVGEARVVVTPIQAMYLAPQRFDAFDVVVVDECSMVTLPQLWLAAGKARVSVLAVGDHMQLPAPQAARGRPVEKVAGRDDGALAERDHDRAAARNSCLRMGDDIFIEAGLTEAIFRDEYLPHLATLTVQHRMRPEICEIVSAVFYGGRLRTAPEVKRRPSQTWPWGLGSVLLVDTSALQPTAAKLPATHSRVNEVHAEVVRAIVDSLTEADPEGGTGRLLITSPFVAQIDVLRQALAQEGAAPTNVHVTTVHQAQGQEAPSVIVTLDDGYGEQASQYVRASGLASAGAKLLNVALSRARDRLLLLADVEFLEDQGGAVVRDLIETMRDRGCVIPVADIVPTEEIGAVKVRQGAAPRRRQAAAKEGRRPPVSRFARVVGGAERDAP